MSWIFASRDSVFCNKVQAIFQINYGEVEMLPLVSFLWLLFLFRVSADYADISIQHVGSYIFYYALDIFPKYTVIVIWEQNCFLPGVWVWTVFLINCVICMLNTEYFAQQ